MTCFSPITFLYMKLRISTGNLSMKFEFYTWFSKGWSQLVSFVVTSVGKRAGQALVACLCIAFFSFLCPT
jgi:hypothetical protein